MANSLFRIVSKLSILAAIVLCMSLSAPRNAKAEEETPKPKAAIVVDIRGGFVGFDQAAFYSVRAIMANLLVDGTLQNWITVSRGLEGGGTYCMEFIPEVIGRKERVLAQFQNIRVDTSTTAYSVEEADHCEIPTLR